MKITLLLILISSSVFAQKGNQFTLDSEMIRSEEELKRIELSDDTENFEGNLTIRSRNNETGIYDTTYDTSDDRSRLSAMFLVDANLGIAMNLNTYEVQYGRKFDLGWLEFSVARTTGVHESISDNYSYADQTNVWSETQIDRPGNYSQNLTSYGIGYGYRFKLFQSIAKESHFFEHTNVYLTYNTMTDFYTEKAYSGPGLKADFLAAHRFGKNFYWGFRLSYNILSLTRAAVNGETPNERTLSFSWLSTGLDLGLYF